MKRSWTYAVAAIVIIGAAALVESANGRLLLCRCGYLKLWHGVVFSPENSQHLTDWYTPSHVLHGVGFYFLLWLAARRLDVGVRVVLAVALEAAWEIAENMPFIIDRYRAATISFDYYGDSIVNSVADTLSMIFGFVLASLLPLWTTVALAVVMEVTLAYLIRDNLTLNIVMLLHSFDAIKAWQATPLLR